MHYLRDLAKQVDSTHANLGRAVAFTTIAVKANKCLLIVSPAGTGKSTLTNLILRETDPSYRMDSVTRSGLRSWTDQLSHFHGCVIIDDMGKIDTPYSRIATVTTFCELCYSHYVSKYAQGTEVSIEDYQGSALLNVQPPILSALIGSDEWEVVTGDKTIRYYHLYRPTAPVSTPLDVTINWGIPFDDVDEAKTSGKLWDKIAEIGTIQWSDARVLEHCKDLLKATAALDNRSTVTQDDYRVLEYMMRPLTIEHYLINKLSFEEGRIFGNNLLAVMIEFATWKHLTVDRIARDYKLPATRVVELLAQLGTAWLNVSFTGKELTMSKVMRQILKEAGVD